MSNRAVFLDRDDTIVDDPGYISKPEQVKLLPGATDALRSLKKLGFKLIVVSNQSAVARGMITEDELVHIHAQLKRLLAHDGVYLDNIYYCPYHPEGVVAEYRKESEYRKPNPGMFLQAAEEMNINLQDSWMIGDSYRDVEAGLKVGCKTILIDTPAKPKTKKADDPEPDFKAVNIKESANIIRMVEQKKTTPEIKPTIENKPIADNTQAQESKPVEERETKQEVNNLKPSDIFKNKQEPKQTPPVQNTNTQQVNKVFTTRNIAEGTTETKGTASTGNTDKLLKEILNELRSDTRSSAYHEFSLIKFLAGFIQIVVVFCLLLALWLLMEGNENSLSVFKPLGFGCVLQIMALTLYVMDEHK